MTDSCAFCAADNSFDDGLHPEVPFWLIWADANWRLFADLTAESSGFSLLAPRRHVHSVADLNRAESASLGPVMSRLMSALQAETTSQSVYLYAFGHEHLHFHLAPHSEGDALSSQIIKGSKVTTHGGGLNWATSAEFPSLPREAHLDTASRVRARL